MGNFGDGRINAFNPLTGAPLGALADNSGNPLVIDGLWALTFGNNESGFDPNDLYFAAGLNDEQDGLFGRLTPPEPATWLLVGAGLPWLIRRRRGGAR